MQRRVTCRLDRHSGDPDKRILDPACGSGTFLVIVIRAIRERARREGRDPAETLEKILANVWGIDLNPLAGNWTTITNRRLRGAVTAQRWHLMSRQNFPDRCR